MDAANAQDAEPARGGARCRGMTYQPDTPDSRQDAKAMARESAQDAPPADPAVAAEAIADAKGVERDGESSVNPVYKTQGKAVGDEHVTGENVHRSKDAVISEFDDPAGNTVGS